MEPAYRLESLPREAEKQLPGTVYRCVTSLTELKEYLFGIETGEIKVLAFDFECSPVERYRHEPDAALDPHKSEITGISLSIKEGTGIYIPLRHLLRINIAEPDQVMAYLTHMVFRNAKVTKVAHNLVYESAFLYKYGIVVVPPVYDTIAASQLTLKSKNEFRELKDSGLKTLVPQMFGVELPSFTEVTAGRHFDELDPQDEATVRYACADSDYSLRLYQLFNDWFDTYLPRHRRICEEVESPTAVYTGMMKYNGLGVDLGLMEQKRVEAAAFLEELRRKIHASAGREVNIGANASTDEFKSFLYEELQLPVLKTTAKNAEAADDETLILLKGWCQENRPEFVAMLELVQEYRKWSKLKSTYIDGYLQHVNSATGRIHADFFPLGTETGRFASRKPNLQNCPRKDSDPVGVRKFFMPRPGFVFLDLDFSQIELRVGAFFCRDRRMLKTYQEDGDIHGITTSVIYRIPFEQAVDKNAEAYKERRVIAKNCNFGVFFGLFPRGLQRTLKFKAGIDKTFEECETIINNIKYGYPGLARWQTGAKRAAHLRKFAETALGRRRYLKGIDSEEWSVRSFWERCALNTPIQGTAADILKLALGRILMGLQERPYIKPVLQVHDELLFEVEETRLADAVGYIKGCMEAVPFPGFDVPIKAEGAMGRNFGELAELG
jgi:DNA polymerase-1